MLLDRFGNKPVHLFVFTRQHLVWRYCTADSDLVIGGLTYVAAQIERGEIKQTVERAKDKLSIKFAYLLDPAALEYPATQALGDNWWPYIPTDTVGVVCMSYDAGTGAAPAVEWIGEVIQPKLSDTEMELVCEPNNGFSRARNQGPKWQRGCWKTPYSTGPRGCNLSLDAFRVEAVATAAAGATVNAAEFAAVPFNLGGGYLTWTGAAGLLERRSIIAHTGESIGLLFGSAGLQAGMLVNAWPTCPRTWAACEARENTDNYGGSVYKPVKNPMDGVSMSWG